MPSSTRASWWPTMVGAAPAQVVFTSGGTEANNQALRGVRGPVAVSAIEHDSVLAAAPDAARIPVDAEGRLDLAALERELARASPVLVSVMLANNETGVIQPVREVGRGRASPWRARALRCGPGGRQAGDRHRCPGRGFPDALGAQVRRSSGRRRPRRRQGTRARSLAARRWPGAALATRHREPAGHRGVRACLRVGHGGRGLVAAHRPLCAIASRRG